MVIVPIDEASKLGIADTNSTAMVTTTASTGEGWSVALSNGNAVSWDLLEIDKPRTLKHPGYIKNGLKYKDKIDAALGFTHYATKGKLFRK